MFFELLSLIVAKCKVISHCLVKPNCPHLRVLSDTNHAPLPTHAGEWWNYSRDEMVGVLKDIGVDNAVDFDFAISEKKGCGSYVVRLIEKIIELNRLHK